MPLVDFNDQKRGRLTLIRDLLDRLPDTHVEPPAIDFPDLGDAPRAESYSVSRDSLRPWSPTMITGFRAWPRPRRYFFWDSLRVMAMQCSSMQAGVPA